MDLNSEKKTFKVKSSSVFYPVHSSLSNILLIKWLTNQLHNAHFKNIIMENEDHRSKHTMEHKKVKLYYYSLTFLFVSKSKYHKTF